MQYKVHVGRFQATYEPLLTTAPRTYDHGEVIEVKDDLQFDDGRQARMILVPVEAVEWQVMRNSSGLHRTLTPQEALGLPDDILNRMITQVLHTRLFRPENL